MAAGMRRDGRRAGTERGGEKVHQSVFFVERESVFFGGDMMYSRDRM